MSATAAAQPRLDAGAAVPDLREVEAFLFDEAELLDAGRFDDWMALFTDDGYYWVPTEPNQKDPFETVSHFYDDRPMMQARILRLKHPSNLVYGPRIRTQHHVNNIRLRGPAADGGCLVTSYVLMVESRPSEQRIFSGACEYSLRAVNGAFRIAYKKVTLVNCDKKFEALGVPF